jgi:cystathionine beta-synthase
VTTRVVQSTPGKFPAGVVSVIHDHVLELVGATPIVDLPGLAAPGSARLVAKVEYFNPGGSVKDRIALAMIDAAEASGELQPGGTIVEPTSGNTGVGLAIAAGKRGYRCVFVCPDKVSEDKIATLRAYGARVEVCPTAVAPEDPRSYYQVSDRLVREIPGAWKPDQYSNEHNWRAHYQVTGPEIWDQTSRRITHFVAGIGTGGTITGTGRYLKEVSDGAVVVVGADPVGSVYSGGSGRPYLVEGVGEDFWPTTYDPSVPDRVIAVSDREAFAMTRRLAREYGLLVGGSSGMAVVAAIQVAESADPQDLVVVLLPDGGRGYLTKVFNDDWLRDFGFLPGQPGTTVRDVLGLRDNALPQLIHVHPSDTIRDAVDLFAKFGVSQLPVLTAEPPVVIAEVVGSVSERHLLDLLFRGEADLADAVRDHVGDPLPTCGIGEPVADIVARLAAIDALLVLSDGAPIGIVTRQDALNFISGEGPGE